jgi:uncharacterized membrane protein required for colicin V production
MLLDIIIVIAFLAYAFMGYRMGIMLGIVGLVKTSFAIIVAVALAKPIGNLADSIFHLGVSDIELWIGSAVAIFLVIQLVLLFFKRIIKRMTENKVVNFADSWLGLLFGVLKLCGIMFIAFSLLFVLAKIPFLSELEDWIIKESAIGNWLYERTVDILNWLF